MAALLLKLAAATHLSRRDDTSGYYACYAPKERLTNTSEERRGHFEAKVGGDLVVGEAFESEGMIMGETTSLLCRWGYFTLGR
jgi:hypothetical protein